MGFHEDNVWLLEKANCHIAKVGEEARIDAATFHMTGKQFSHLRANCNHARRALHIREIIWSSLRDDEQHQIINALSVVTAEFFSSKSLQKQIQFFQGTFCTPPRKRRIFVACRHDSPAAIEAFLVCNPYENGSSWSAEITHRTPLATRGASHLLISEAITSLRADGCRTFSLTLVPGLRCNQSPHRLFPISNILELGYRFGSSVYDMKGIYEYKRRFNPHFRPLFIGFFPRVTLRHAIAAMKCINITSFNSALAVASLVKRVMQ